jgi:shikimate kinase
MEAPPTRIVLCGLMGSGKSSVGRELARRLGWRLRDSDPEIETATGETVAGLSRSRGVEAMHDLEEAALHAALADRTPSVVAAAASILDRPRAIAALALPGIVVVALEAPAATLAERFGSRPHRPTFDRSPLDLFTEQIAQRSGALARIATATFATTTADPAAVAAAIAERLGLSEA